MAGPDPGSAWSQVSYCQMFCDCVDINWVSSRRTCRTFRAFVYECSMHCLLRYVPRSHGLCLCAGRTGPGNSVPLLTTLNFGMAGSPQQRCLGHRRGRQSVWDPPCPPPVPATGNPQRRCGAGDTASSSFTFLNSFLIGCSVVMVSNICLCVFSLLVLWDSVVQLIQWVSGNGIVYFNHCLLITNVLP